MNRCALFTSRRLLQFSAVRMSTADTIYQFTVKDADNKEVSLDKYKGHVVIMVNVASQCGFTKSNYTQLKELLDKYKSQGLEVAAFPCNQFGGQEPGSEDDIKKFVESKFNFKPDLYAKIDVNGANAAPLYEFLKKEKGGTLIDAIKWNFTKFLIDRNGKVNKRYAPTTEPKEMVPDIEALLAEKSTSLKF
ncbi:Glutathione peroxidase 2 [Parelaphostrongylus tenuis]|uniref:Glutathione peroxidase n=1 Tax=Parelaphostrongylus tenuis TaxID=148309 RepID=A0AAD5QGD7_PARTN|nr:Glutathione peroxidase 2 [Parelaphostrongylus tenuis]